MKKYLLLTIGILAALALLSSEAIAKSRSTPKIGDQPGDKQTTAPILQRWEGDCPLSRLDCLPPGQSLSPVGYMGDAAAFASVWRVLKPGTVLPEVDFKKHLVVFVRNVEAYHRTLVARVVLKDGVANIVAAEPLMSAPPIEDRVAMGLAVISREGLAFIQTDKERIPVR